MTKILIIEDEKPAVRRLTQLLSEHLPEAQVLESLDTVSSAVNWFSTNPEPDLIFLDIQLADGISFEIFEKVKITAPIIFCTAYDQYAIKAFKLNSIDYLLKPIDPEELAQALTKFKSGRKEAGISLEQIRSLMQPTTKAFKTRFLIKLGERIQSVDTQDIAFFFSEDKVTLLQTRQGKKYIVDYILDEIEEMVSPEQFFRINRKYISSIYAIRDVFTYSNSRLKVHLENCSDNDILISRERMGAFKSWLGQ
ncbi:LytTR family DNA-binding domain-containing protein [Dyadobacter chenwenxiniae]|uniref:LytTR family DNA-binding domain-containing protein n=1 Tax=Dyadobacter chenwenxiniae TaxID=2906456 RepID=A0A9X1PQW0_9BACT|nr:LytTR family DNA-binding domain-containing protein [Dyadobacter chenwenxiniae]MCF0064023.1 LytTR family DNA-binding domain-containing protein [Dyadobacter chenwenxiniae]UON82750.1 LytTR family DNA-binding domain-containing protein [Dyadobacter chenwenxiniae]